METRAAHTETPRGHRGLILRAMLSMANADGTLHRSEADAIRRVYAEVTGDEIVTREIHGVRWTGRREGRPVVEQLVRERHKLSLGVREMILKSAYLVLLADGRVGARERKKLADFADALEISEIHRNVILEDVEPALH